MSDVIDTDKAMDEHREALRAKFGVPCPQCRIARPKTNPSILLPQQRCRVDKYVDPRPQLTNEQWGSA